VWVDAASNINPPHTWRGFVYTNHHGVIRRKLATYYEKVGFEITDGFHGEFVTNWYNDCQPPTAVEDGKEAMEFGEWLRANHFSSYRNSWRRYGSYMERTTTELYNIFKEQNK